MPKLIKNDQIIDDSWLVVTAAEDAQPTIAAGQIYPLAFWLANKDAILSAGHPVGVWLDSNEDPASLAADAANMAVIAVNFPKFTDGRGYSTARLLRERFGYTGEIRAIGDVLHDQLFLMKRCGFDSFAIRCDKNPEEAIAGLKDFSETYQAAWDQPQPLFRRRCA